MAAAAAAGGLFEQVTGRTSAGGEGAPKRKAAGQTPLVRKPILSPTSAFIELSANPGDFRACHPEITCKLGKVQFENKMYTGLQFDTHDTKTTKITRMRVRISDVVYTIGYQTGFDLRGTQPIIDSRPFKIPPKPIVDESSYDDMKDKGDRDYKPGDKEPGSSSSSESDGGPEDDDPEAETEERRPLKKAKVAEPVFPVTLVRKGTSKEKEEFAVVYKKSIAEGTDHVCAYQRKHMSKIPQDRGYWWFNLATRGPLMVSTVLPAKIGGPQHVFLWEDGDLWEFGTEEQMIDWWSARHPAPKPPPVVPDPKKAAGKKGAAEGGASMTELQPEAASAPLKKKKKKTPPATAAAAAAVATTGPPCSKCHTPMNIESEARRKAMLLYEITPGTHHIIETRAALTEDPNFECGDCDGCPPLSEWDPYKFEKGLAAIVSDDDETKVVADAELEGDDPYANEDDEEDVDDGGEDDDIDLNSDDDAKKEAAHLKPTEKTKLVKKRVTELSARIERMRAAELDPYLTEEYNVAPARRQSVKNEIKRILGDPKVDPGMVLERWKGKKTEPVFLILTQLISDYLDDTDESAVRKKDKKKKKPKPIESTDTQEFDANEQRFQRQLAEASSPMEPMPAAAAAAAAAPSPPARRAPPPPPPPPAQQKPPPPPPQRAAAAPPQPAIDNEGFMDLSNAAPGQIKTALVEQKKAVVKEKPKSIIRDAEYELDPAAEYERGRKEAFNEILAKCNCPICMQPMRLPMTPQCGHSVCQSCKVNMHDSSGRKTCSQCKQLIDKPWYRLYALKHIVDTVTGVETAETYVGESTLLERRKKEEDDAAEARYNFDALNRLLTQYHTVKKHASVSRMPVVAGAARLNADLIVWKKSAAGAANVHVRMINYYGKPYLEAFDEAMDPTTIAPPPKPAARLPPAAHK